MNQPESAQPTPGGPVGPPGGGPGVRPERPRRRGRFVPRRKVCAFCVDHIDYIDYKDPSRLRRYVSERGKIEPRRKTGTCARHQRTLTQSIKRARHIALLPFTAAHMRDAMPMPPRFDRGDRPFDRGDRPFDRGDRP